MGACFETMEVDGQVDAKALQAKFQRYQEHCSYESGNSYSGRLNMCSGLRVLNEVFDSYSKAEDYISQTAQKWEDAVAVRYKVSSPVKESAKLVRYKEQRSALSVALGKLKDELADKVKAKLKSVEFIKCTGCKSKLDTRFSSRTLRCPVCDGSFASTSDQKKILGIQDKLSSLETKIKEEYNDLQQKASESDKDQKVVWLIGGWCSS